MIAGVGRLNRSHQRLISLLNSIPKRNLADSVPRPLHSLRSFLVSGSAALTVGCLTVGCIAVGGVCFTAARFPTVLHALVTDSRGFEHTESNMSIIDEAEKLYEEHKFVELYDYLLPHKESEDADVLWRLVRATRDRANVAGVDAAEKKTMIFEAFEVAKRALAIGEENFAVHKWYGIMLSQTGDYDGKKAKLGVAPAMKTHWERAVELNPKDSTSHHLLGMWTFSFADLAWYERKIAATVFGEVPAATYEEALEHFLKAEEMDPSGYSTNLFMIGTVYLRLSKKPDAKEWFTKLLDYECHKEEDKENVEKAKKELKSL